jgi:cyclic pyranopterin phosphate synthase
MDDWNIDSHKLHYHPARVAQWLEADTWEKAKKVYPLYWEITTSAACNHRCTFCSVDAIGYPAILFDAGILGKRMEEAARLGVKSVMFAGTGEPLVHKRISGITETRCARASMWHSRPTACCSSACALSSYAPGSRSA